MISPPSSTTSEHTTQGRHCAVEFQALPSRIGQVRRIVSAQLHHWRLEALIDATALGLTELLTNVHQHAEAAGGADDGHDGLPGARTGKHCTVELTYAWGRLTVSVHDHDPRLPRVRGSAGRERLSTHGRGLALVAAISESWGVRAQRDGSGKTVWFSLPVPSPAPAREGRTRPGAAAREGAAREGSARDGRAGEPGADTAPADRRPAVTPAPVLPPAGIEAATAG
ncbi:ATP-binding protein [Streptomyces albus]|uniref:ATP-binding protein n=1 Tax=Streptomyces albus TaxID=1888 RepID=UPI0033DD5B62